MRDIEFKGLSINGEWVYGFYLKIDNSIFIIDCCEDKIPIRPETVCEYTGRIDKANGKIYEHDIVRHNGEIGRIKYNSGAFFFQKESNTVHLNSIAGIHMEILGNELMETYLSQKFGG